MRTLIACVIAGIAGEAFAHAPFEPSAGSPDHVVTMVQTEGPGRTRDRIVTRRGEWTRVETTWEGRRTVQYFKRGGVTVSINHGKADEYSGVSIFLGREPGTQWDREPIKTNQRETFLGESCTVWNVARSRTSRNELVQTSCITDDGIELWYKFASATYEGSRAEAVRVERRVVTRAETEPPLEPLQIEGWFTESPASATSKTQDFELLMQQDGAPEFTRITKQRGGWRLEDDRLGATRQRFSLSNPDAGRVLSFTYLSADNRTLTINQTQPIPRATDPKWRPQLMNRPSETVAGEQCIWFDMSPGMMDASRSACRTRDGITLKEAWYARGRATRILTAIRLVRRPVALDEIKPPADLLNPKTWGLPD